MVRGVLRLLDMVLKSRLVNSWGVVRGVVRGVLRLLDIVLKSRLVKSWGRG